MNWLAEITRGTPAYAIFLERAILHVLYESVNARYTPIGAFLRKMFFGSAANRRRISAIIGGILRNTYPWYVGEGVPAHKVDIAEETGVDQAYITAIAVAMLADMPKENWIEGADAEAGFTHEHMQQVELVLADSSLRAALESEDGEGIVPWLYFLGNWYIPAMRKEYELSAIELIRNAFAIYRDPSRPKAPPMKIREFIDMMKFIETSEDAASFLASRISALVEQLVNACEVEIDCTWDREALHEIAAYSIEGLLIFYTIDRVVGDLARDAVRRNITNDEVLKPINMKAIRDVIYYDTPIDLTDPHLEDVARDAVANEEELFKFPIGDAQVYGLDPDVARVAISVVVDRDKYEPILNRNGIFLRPPEPEGYEYHFLLTEEQQAKVKRDWEDYRERRREFSQANVGHLMADISVPEKPVRIDVLVGANEGVMGARAKAVRYFPRPIHEEMTTNIVNMANSSEDRYLISILRGYEDPKHVSYVFYEKSKGVIHIKENLSAMSVPEVSYEEFMEMVTAEREGAASPAELAQQEILELQETLSEIEAKKF